jgi:hypothetical protein
MAHNVEKPPESLRTYARCTDTEMTYLIRKANDGELDQRKLLCLIVELYRRSSHNRLFDILGRLAALK